MISLSVPAILHKYRSVPTPSHHASSIGFTMYGDGPPICSMPPYAAPATSIAADDDEVNTTNTTTDPHHRHRSSGSIIIFYYFIKRRQQQHPPAARARGATPIRQFTPHGIRTRRTTSWCGTCCQRGHAVG